MAHSNIPDSQVVRVHEIWKTGSPCLCVCHKAFFSCHKFLICLIFEKIIHWNILWSLVGEKELFKVVSE